MENISLFSAGKKTTISSSPNNGFAQIKNRSRGGSGIRLSTDFNQPKLYGENRMC